MQKAIRDAAKRNDMVSAKVLALNPSSLPNSFVKFLLNAKDYANGMELIQQVV